MIRRISGPDDIKKMNIEELNELAGSIRCHLINTVSKTGGHLAPNLGTVELTIAMHKVFSSPRDKMVFDVGHQCYTHKLLTGRKDRFHTLRQEDGLSGFPKREESEHDAFNTGHSSTSVSASLGIAAGAKLKRDDGNVICVIGDGALTGGVALEGLNQAGYLKTNLIIILNDNEMSIASNVGGMSEYTSRIKNTDIYQNVKKEVEALIEANGTCGEHAKAIKDELKYLLNPGIVFQKLGIDYLGPIDGHNIKELICTLDEAKKRRKPVLVHIKTIKGKGYVFAEANAERFHGISSFDITNGQKNGTKKETFTSIFGKQMVKMGYNDQKTIAITAAMPSGTGLTDFAKHFPDRFFDVGIAEQHAVTFAAGLATQGFRPVVAIYSTFLQRAYDQIIHDVALQKLPVTFAIDRGGMVGEDGPTHHGVFDLSYLRHIPNMTVMVPRDEIELCDMMDFAQKHDGPIAYRYPRDNVVGADPEKKRTPIAIGRSEILKPFKNNHLKKKIAILCTGHIINDVISSVDGIDKDIDVMIVNARFVKPLDTRLIESISQEADHIVTVEENSSQGGFGSAVLEYVEDLRIKGEIKTRSVIRFGLPDKFIEHAPLKRLKELYGLTGRKIIDSINSLG